MKGCYRIKAQSFNTKYRMEFTLRYFKTNKLCIILLHGDHKIENNVNTIKIMQLNR